MLRNRKAFTLIELLVVIAIIAILAAILFPVFAQAKASAKLTADLSNVKNVALGTLMYAADNDDHIPQLDNNGDCIYGDNPCATPDWGVATPNPNNTADRPMFANVIQPYIKNWQMMYSTDVGKTNWSTAVAQQAQMGIVLPTPYSAANEDLYYGSLGFYAANILIADRWGRNNNNLTPVSRPAEIVMLAESAWGYGLETQLAVGNTGVWPNRPGTSCFDWGQGWTWYPHRSNSRGGSYRNMVSGLTTAAFVDGHVKSVKYDSLERCDYFAESNVWAYTHWDARY